MAFRNGAPFAVTAGRNQREHRKAYALYELSVLQRVHSSDAACSLCPTYESSVLGAAQVRAVHVPHDLFVSVVL